MPYTFRGDDTLALLMLAGFIVIAMSLGFMRRFVFLQMKNLFRVPRNDAGRSLLSAIELRMQLVLVMQTAMELAVLLYLYSSDWINGAGATMSRHLYTLVFFLLILAYFCIKSALYRIVNAVFFDGRVKRDWMYALLFLTAMEGVLLFPVTLCSVYMSLSQTTILVAAVVVIGVVKMLTFCKCFNIFFNALGGYVQFFLYLCTLEIVPLFIMWAGLESMEYILK